LAYSGEVESLEGIPQVDRAAVCWPAASPGEERSPELPFQEEELGDISTLKEMERDAMKEQRILTHARRSSIGSIVRRPAIQTWSYKLS